ncbi:hypothetical protein C1646_776976 [Rhizophagus diaphanus]|nr:hypothetical protein C1646_776976 [Rhizophagus diaphanus] [Rhizophagus sp. MUCL 43196]
MLYFQIERPVSALKKPLSEALKKEGKRAQEVAKSEDKWDIFINTLDLGPKGSKNGVIDDKEMQEQTEKRLADSSKTPDHFTFEKVLRRLQNIDTSKIPFMQDLADVIVILNMRPAEVSSLQIINYKPVSEDPPAWYKASYSWYCIRCRKQREKLMPMRLLFMEKNPEHARELLTWIQDTIKAKKLRDPNKDEITPEVLRKIEAKHVSMVHAGLNPTPQYLDHLSEIAIRHKINCLDAEKNYALGDPESKKKLNSGPKTSDGSKPQTQASSPAS